MSSWLGNWLLSSHLGRRSFWVLVLLLFSLISFAEDKQPYNLGQIIVTGTRIPVGVAQVTQRVEVIGEAEIRRAPVSSVVELLSYALGVDLRRRGIAGVQSDVSIRGSTFQQVIILLDGVKISDPQTAHHNLDLPISLDDVQRIEILRGATSAVYGSDGIGGVINIITRKPEEEAREISQVVGEHRFRQTHLRLDVPSASGYLRLGAEQTASAGHWNNTDFDIFTFSSHLWTDALGRESSVFLGYTDKKFGANSFYTPLFPDQWEATSTTLVTIRTTLESESLAISPLLHWRRHEDEFQLDRSRPEWFRNQHTSDSYGGTLEGMMAGQWGNLTLGVEAAGEEIESSNLGDHSRDRFGAFLEIHPELPERYAAVVGLRGDYYSDWDWEVSPSAGLSYQIIPSAKLRASLGRSFRVPDYTELYYQSPANLGNPDLEPEKAWSYELGLDKEMNGFIWQLALFERRGDNLIDWVRNEASSPWQVQNVSDLRTQGLEVDLKVPGPVQWSALPLSHLSLGYAFLHSDRDTAKQESKYLLDHLEHQFLLAFDCALGRHWISIWKLRYQERETEDGKLILDLRVQRGFFQDNLTVFISGMNLLDTEYSEVSGVKMPGTWVKLGFKYSF